MLTDDHSADSMVAATLMPFFIIMCELFNGILQPHENMPVFWKYTMYYATPFTYWIGGVLTAVLRGMPVICDSSELTMFESPPNMTCAEYAGPWLAEHGVGYLSNPDDTSKCGYCNSGSGINLELPQVGRNRKSVIITLIGFPEPLISGFSPKRKAEGGFCSDRDFIIEDQAIGKKDSSGLL
ncbi:unnamed protein product [Aspergillus oryzae]|uniref:Unnamed protein product n=2 Tax=Aspergillus oryzae TaxID=5062 RepID=A0AAN4YX38_ASPOZ|nr:unnamed protein product [Aspergillus oryzae]GMF88563.1 unnamed protein product [Aspergillus oryzae]GMG06714.1 unnamed protein product [Aspergillus oryzae]GMG36707.1 unnamed protein product [Aspergillus oryzae]GMG52462.1 unnamed protein product [Aspergillus oryzae var. brunneus]